MMPLRGFLSSLAGAATAVRRGGVDAAAEPSRFRPLRRLLASPLGVPLAPTGARGTGASFAASAGPCASSVAASAGKPPVLNSLYQPLAFVNRYAEALDVLVPNICNHEALRTGRRIKYLAPLASQPPGTGKTALAENITAILRRPREASAAAEADVAKRLAGAWCWHGAKPVAIEEALHNSCDENLVMRTLLAMCDPAHHETLLALKQTEPLVIEMKGLVTPSFGLDFDGALAYAIFCEAHRLDGSLRETRAAFLSLDPTEQSAVGAVKAMMKERGGAPLVLVLDDITNLQDPVLQPYFTGARSGSNLHRAMSVLSTRLQLLHAIPRCFIMCTGPSLWLSTRALAPLNVVPTLLQPLTAGDVREALRTTVEPGGRTLFDCLGVAPAMEGHLAERAVALTGGVGRTLQYLLRARQWAVERDAAAITSREELDAALEALRPHMADLPGMMLRIEWDGPKLAVGSDDVSLGAL